MSGVPRAPAAPRLRAIREAWLGPVLEQLQADPAISAVGFVGSIGRGDADDWSDVDLVIVVPDDQVGRYADAARRRGPGRVALSFDARHNAPRGAGSVGVHYVIDGLPFNADWYVYPDSQGAWVADAKVVLDRRGLRRLSDTFAEHLAKREVQPPVPKPADAHRLLQIALIPVAAKRIARRSPGAGRMVEFVGGPHAPGAAPAEHLEMLRGLLGQYRGVAPAERLSATSRYLDLVADVL
jgi:predicted nucleotidyltransferase